MSKKTLETDFTKGSILKLLILFTVPLLIGDLFQQFYNLADSIIVGRFVGKAALAAVGSTAALINTVIGLFLGCSVGAGVVISQRYGAKAMDELSRSIHTTAAITLIFSACFTVLGVLLAPTLLRMISTPSDVFDTALLYLRIYFFGISGLIIYNMSGGILRAIGDSKRPIYALIISAITNVLLDLLFVLVFHWGIAGVAIATVIAQFGSAAYLVYTLCRVQGAYRLNIKQIAIDKDLAREILRIGLPIGSQRTITALSNTIVQSHINAFGSDCMAGWAVYNKVHQFATLPIDNIGTATVTFVGQNYGAKNWKRVKQSIRTAGILNFTVAMAISVVLYLLAEPFARLFSVEIGVVGYGVMFLRLLSLIQPITTINRTFAGAVRGLGDGKGPMVTMLIGFVIARQVYLAIIEKLPMYSVQLVALSYPVGWFTASVLVCIYYQFVSKKIEQQMTMC